MSHDGAQSSIRSYEIPSPLWGEGKGEGDEALFIIFNTLVTDALVRSRWICSGWIRYLEHHGHRRSVWKVSVTNMWILVSQAKWRWKNTQ